MLNRCLKIASAAVFVGAVLLSFSSVSQTLTALSDVCQNDGDYSARKITSGQEVCLQNTATRRHLAIGQSSDYDSLAITVGYGEGNTTLFAKNGRWPKKDGTEMTSSRAGNQECIVIHNPSKYWTYLLLEGEASNVSLVVDLGASQCRSVNDTRGPVTVTANPNPTANPQAPTPVSPPNPSQPSNADNSGYKRSSVNISVYRFEFADAPLEWSETQIMEELDKVKAYYQKQSYGKFDVTYTMDQPIIQISEPKANFDNNFHKWRELYQQRLRDLGVDPKEQAPGNVIMITAPQVGNFNSTAAPPLMTIFHYNAGVIAHELGHALGLRHAKALDAGGRIVGQSPSEQTVVNYGNVFSLMGMGAHAMTEYNLVYKHFFGWLDLENDVPLVDTSGVYRIYAFDHGRAQGNIGLRLAAGNNEHTFWLEYRTTGRYADRTKQGVLFNLEGNFTQENDKRFWKTTSLLLDMTPNSKTGQGWWGDDQIDSALMLGKTFTDPWGNFRVTPIRTGGEPNTSDAWIEVEIDAL